MKIEREGKSEEKKNKEDDRSTSKLAGSATYLCLNLDCPVINFSC